jgi:hypothetical protein
VQLAGIIKSGMAYRNIIQELFSLIAANQHIRDNLKGLFQDGANASGDQEDAGLGGGRGGSKDPGTGRGTGRGKGGTRGQKRARDNDDQHGARPGPSRSADDRGHGHPAAAQDLAGCRPNEVTFEFEQDSDVEWNPLDRITQWLLPVLTPVRDPSDGPQLVASDSDPLQTANIAEDTATVMSGRPRAISTSTQHTVPTPNGIVLPSEYREPDLCLLEETEWSAAEYPMVQVSIGSKGALTSYVRTIDCYTDVPRLPLPK